MPFLWLSFLEQFISGFTVPIDQEKRFKKAELKTVVGRNLTRLIKQSPHTAKELAEHIGVDYRNFNRWKSTKESDPLPPTEHLPELCYLLNCTMDDLFSFDPQFLPQTQEERELLMVARNAAPHLPRYQIINALSLALGKLSSKERRLWLSVGNALAKDK